MCILCEYRSRVVLIPDCLVLYLVQCESASPIRRQEAWTEDKDPLTLTLTDQKSLTTLDCHFPVEDMTHLRHEIDPDYGQDPFFALG